MTKSSSARRARAAARKKKPGTRRDAQGRLHLRLERDPVNGKQHLALRKPVFEQAWQNEITAATANTARGLLGESPSLKAAVELAQSVMAATSRVVDAMLAQAPAGAVACRAGCDHCCYQSVGVTAPEALAIFDHLQRNLAREEIEAVAARISELYAKTRGLSAGDRFSPDLPCPFLESGNCSIYELRPLSCRGMNSLDAEECRARLRDPEARAEFLANGVGGRSYMEPIRAFHAVSAGLQLGLSELYQLDMLPLDLTAALHVLFSGPQSVAADWVRGEKPFESARGGDNSETPGIRELSGAVDFGPR